MAASPNGTTTWAGWFEAGGKREFAHIKDFVRVRRGLTDSDGFRSSIRRGPGLRFDWFNAKLLLDEASRMVTGGAASD